MLVSPEHVSLGAGSLLQYDPHSGNFSIFRLSCPCPSFWTEAPIRRGVLPALRKHAYLGEDRLLETDPKSGSYNIYTYHRLPGCASNTERASVAFPRVIQWGAHPDFVGADPVYIDDDELLLYRPNGSFSVRLYDRSASRRLLRPRTDRALPLSALETDTFQTPAGEAWPGEAVAKGVWSSASPPTSVAYLGGALLLGSWVGSWQLRRYDRSAWGFDGVGRLNPRPVLWPAASGTWATGTGSTQHIPIGDQLLAYDVASCDIQVVSSPRIDAKGSLDSSTSFDASQRPTGSFCQPAMHTTPRDASGSACTYGGVVNGAPEAFTGSSSPATHVEA